MIDKETFMHRKGEILHEARMDGNDTFDGLAGSIVYWQDVANYAHEKRVEAEQRIAQLEAALVEERARVILYEADGTIRDWGDVSESEQELYLHHARGALKNLAS